MLIYRITMFLSDEQLINCSTAVLNCHQKATELKSCQQNTFSSSTNLLSISVLCQTNFNCMNQHIEKLHKHPSVISGRENKIIYFTLIILSINTSTATHKVRHTNNCT